MVPLTVVTAASTCPLYPPYLAEGNWQPGGRRAQVTGRSRMLWAGEDTVGSTSGAPGRESGVTAQGGGLLPPRGGS